MGKQEFKISSNAEIPELKKKPTGLSLKEYRKTYNKNSWAEKVKSDLCADCFCEKKCKQRRCLECRKKINANDRARRRNKKLA